jgi:PAS domain-containing protein
MAVQQPIEVILLKQWASYIAVPVWICDEAGNLIFYNEPAESVLGQRFDEAGPIHASELAERYATSDLDGTPLPGEELPIVVALQQRVPAHRALRIKDYLGQWRAIQVSAAPIEGQGGRHLGAFAMFWET